MLRILNHSIIHKDPFAYCAHPHIARLHDDEIVVVFNKVIRRPFILHPPNDPHFHNMLIRSADEGRTWSTPRVVPGYEWHGVECAGLTVLQDGALLLNQWRFKWYPLETARELAHVKTLTFPDEWAAELVTMGEMPLQSIPSNPAESVPWARGNDGTYTHRSTNGGRTWEPPCKISTVPFAGGYGMRGAVQLGNGEILLPLSDVPNYRVVFIVRSGDGGRSWCAPVEAACTLGKYFEEPSLLALDDTRLIMMLRDNSSHFMHLCNSNDGGCTWSEPRPVDFLGYPCQLLRLIDGRILCTFGYRYKPFGIRAVLSNDEGRHWDTLNPLMLRYDFQNNDLGYPATIMMKDGSLLTTYYGQDIDGVTCIWTTRFSLVE